MSNKSRNRRRRAASTDPSRTVREQKRAQFEGRSSRSRLPIIGAVVALAMVAAVALYVTSDRNASGVEAASTMTASGSGADVTIPLAEVNDGKAHFYSYNAGGVEVKYFVLRSSDGVVRAAFDACDVCYAQKKGYHQEGDEMVCKNCGRRFPSTEINVLEGGCNPSPLDRTEAADRLLIAGGDLQAGVQYFQ